MIALLGDRSYNNIHVLLMKTMFQLYTTLEAGMTNQVHNIVTDNIPPNTNPKSMDTKTFISFVWMRMQYEVSQ